MVDYSRYKNIKVERQGRILRLTINRPHALNAVDEALHTELACIFYDVALDREADIVILSGEGRAFCAGGDITWMQDAIDKPEMFEVTGIEGKRIVYSLLDLEKPVICRLNGDAIGLGATIALFCDVIIAGESARIGDPHVRVGLVAGDGGAVIWPQLIGYARAKEYLMTGDLILAAEAARIGLINHAVPDAELDARVDAFAEKLLRGAGKAIRWSKMSVNIGLKQLAHSIMDASIGWETVANLTTDHAEGVASFREKRRPVFGKTTYGTES